MKIETTRVRRYNDVPELHDREWLLRHRRNKNYSEISRILKVKCTAVRYWCHALGVEEALRSDVGTVRSRIRQRLQ